jgi:hypothetical protein
MVRSESQVYFTADRFRGYLDRVVNEAEKFSGSCGQRDDEARLAKVPWRGNLHESANTNNE